MFRLGILFKSVLDSRSEAKESQFMTSKSVSVLVNIHQKYSESEKVELNLLRIDYLRSEWSDLGRAVCLGIDGLQIWVSKADANSLTILHEDSLGAGHSCVLEIDIGSLRLGHVKVSGGCNVVLDSCVELFWRAARGGHNRWVSARSWNWSSFNHL